MNKGVYIFGFLVLLGCCARAQTSNWNAAFESTRCVAVPARQDSDQAVPAFNAFVRVLGKPVNPPVVLIHGTSASHNYWIGVAEILSSKYFVILPDLRGHGQSQSTPTNTGFRYTLEVFAKDIAAVLDGIGEHRPVVYGGISIGAGIGITFAANFPGRTARLVSVSGAAQFRCADNTLPNCPPPGFTGVATTPITLLPEDVASGCNVNAARDKIQQNRAVSGVAVGSLVAHAQTVNQTALLATIRAPTLIVHGLADPTLSAAAAEALHAGIVNSVRADFVNRGHLLPITAKDDMAKLIGDFAQGTVFPQFTRVLDDGCQIAERVAPEASFGQCAAI
jgi:pimeloyl-ACP methyl ester carboxylesterase